uniref:Uncharacterized protein n=1 Tax=Cajanus cajan TaxID=3821 RepID=A0A151R1G6_CAJCA|nr:hypothetical protein KK1_042469 [Cajanus cajan]
MVYNSRGSEVWRVIFSNAVYEFWRAHNALVFEQILSTTHGLVASICQRCIDITNAFAHYKGLSTCHQSDPYGSSHVQWIPPPLGSIKLNCDSMVRDIGRNVACGGIIRTIWEVSS